MRTSGHYKGMFLRSRAFELKDGGGWTADVSVAEEDGADNVDSLFVLKPTFQTEELAHGSALATARKIVDDKIKGWDIRSLIEEETRLPSTHRSAFGCRSDDVAMGAGGEAIRVPSAGNPDDRFS